MAVIYTITDALQATSRAFVKTLWVPLRLNHFNNISSPWKLCPWFPEEAQISSPQSNRQIDTPATGIFRVAVYRG